MPFIVFPTKNGVMMTGSDNVQIPIDELHAIGSALQSIKTELEAAENALTELSGQDDVHGMKMQTAVDGFFAEWKTSRLTLVQNIGKLGIVSGEIADRTASFDSDLAGALGALSEQLLPPKGPMQ